MIYELNIYNQEYIVEWPIGDIRAVKGTLAFLSISGADRRFG